jgi:hypothetical protein
LSENVITQKTPEEPSSFVLLKTAPAREYIVADELQKESDKFDGIYPLFGDFDLLVEIKERRYKDSSIREFVDKHFKNRFPDIIDVMILTGIRYAGVVC